MVKQLKNYFLLFKKKCIMIFVDMHVFTFSIQHFYFEEFSGISGGDLHIKDFLQHSFNISLYFMLFGYNNDVYVFICFSYANSMYNYLTIIHLYRVI